jgi:hypothetical protein
MSDTYKQELADNHLVNGRLAAAEKVISDLSVETLSLSRTEALLGYPFDFTMPGAEEQDEQRLHEHRDSLSTADRAAAIPIAKLPNADQHRKIVSELRQSSTAYHTLQQIVRLLVLFREWREEEQTLIQSVNPSFIFEVYQLTSTTESVPNARKTGPLRNTSLIRNARKRSWIRYPTSSTPSSLPSPKRRLRTRTISHIRLGS